MSAPFSSTADALSWATNQLRATSDTARLDAELLLAHALGWSRARILAERHGRLSEAQQAALRDLVVRRAALEPIAYLIGHKEFYGLDFLVDRHVLIPRPETELLVDRTLALARQMTTDHQPMPSSEAKGPTIEDRDSKIEDRYLSTGKTRSSNNPSVVIADIGTGSGCVAIALAVHLREAMIYAVDISPEALSVARQNIERHGVVKRVRLIEGDLLDALPEAVDVLVSNPPYTILNEIDAGVRRHEPHLALDGGADGLDMYRRLLAAAPAKLRTGGAVLLEIGATQGTAVADLARAHFPAARINVYQDLAGLDRVVIVEMRAVRRAP